MLNPLDLIPAPYNLIAKIGLPILAIGGVWIAGDVHGHRAKGQSDAAQHAADQGTIANLKAASTTAKAQNVAHVATVENKQTQVTKDHANDAPNAIAIGNAAIAEYVRLHPAKANSSGPASAGLSQVPDPASKPDAAGAETVVPVSDLDACNVAYATAIGLQGWIRDQAAIVR